MAGKKRSKLTEAATILELNEWMPRRAVDSGKVPSLKSEPGKAQSRRRTKRSQSPSRQTNHSTHGTDNSIHGWAIDSSFFPRHQARLKHFRIPSDGS